MSTSDQTYPKWPPGLWRRIVLQPGPGAMGQMNRRSGFTDQRIEGDVNATDSPFPDGIPFDGVSDLRPGA